MSPSSANGILKVERKGLLKCQIGDGEVVELDVIKVFNDWWALDRSLRNEKGEIVPEKSGDWSMLAWQFVNDLFNQPGITQAEALEFIAQITERANALKPFFEPRSSVEPPSPGRTGVTFST